MFGYVTFNREQLTDAQYERYRAFYCGLCHGLKRASGNSGRITLSHDMAFLGVLLTSLYEPRDEGGSERCFLHPRKPHPYVMNRCIAYASDMNIVLAYHKCRDDWADDRNAVKFAEKLLLGKSYSRIRAAYPRQVAAVERAMEAGSRAEKSGSATFDDCLNASEGLLSEIFVMEEDMWADDLRRMGASLARFVYAMDAYEDLEKDKKSHSFNPLIAMESRPDFEDWVRRVLTLLISECTEAFENLPIVEDEEILRNILYSGVWTRYAMLQAKKQDTNQSKQVKT